jgi:hypothetical protein
MLTAQTITELQISQLQLRAMARGDSAIVSACCRAIEYDRMHWTLDALALEARGICAAAINSEKLPELQYQFVTDAHRVFTVDGRSRIVVKHRRPGGRVLGDTAIEAVVELGDCQLERWPELFVYDESADDGTWRITALGREVLMQAVLNR